jgi:predicted AlkP superfamily phosphohydrolase/phosphomutase
MGHYLWQYHLEEGLPDDAESRSLHESIVAFYRMVDAAIGELVEAAGEETMVVVASDHGMGPSYTKIAHWNDWLHEQGYLELAESSRRTVDGWLLRLGLARDRLRRLAGRVPGLLDSRIANAVRAAPTAVVDAARSTITYERIFDPVGGFRISAAGDERDALRTELMTRLVHMRDPETGKPIIEQVMTREECFSGPYTSTAPDVIIVMKPEYGSSDRMSHYSAVVTERPEIRDPGSHQMNGIIVMCGDGIPHDSEPLDGVAIEDVAPTVLHRLGVGVPSDMDGRVLEEVFDAADSTSRRPRTVAPQGRWPSEEEAQRHLADKDSDDEKAVLDRLRALGYFE